MKSLKNFFKKNTQERKPMYSKTTQKEHPSDYPGGSKLDEVEDEAGPPITPG